MPILKVHDHWTSGQTEKFCTETNEKSLKLFPLLLFPFVRAIRLLVVINTIEKRSETNSVLDIEQPNRIPKCNVQVHKFMEIVALFNQNFVYLKSECCSEWFISAILLHVVMKFKFLWKNHKWETSDDEDELAEKVISANNCDARTTTGRWDNKV